MSPLAIFKRRGVLGAVAYAFVVAKRQLGWHSFRFRHAPRYQEPTTDELVRIESSLADLGIRVNDYRPDAQEFLEFQATGLFPSDYHGGRETGVWEEKLREHFIAYKLLDLEFFSGDDVYVDVAACNSPWAHSLRTRYGLNAYVVDLFIGEAFQDLSYYRKENATSTSFPDVSVKAASLHCAFEMFAGREDYEFVSEAARIIAPGGKIVIVPLYMHTHYCSYSTPEYWGRTHSDEGVKEYIRLDGSGVPSSRKYDAAALKRRILDPIEVLGLKYRLLALRNKEELGSNINCHFILEIYK